MEFTTMYMEPIFMVEMRGLDISKKSTSVTTQSANSQFSYNITDQLELSDILDWYQMFVLACLDSNDGARRYFDSTIRASPLRKYLTEEASDRFAILME